MKKKRKETTGRQQYYKYLLITPYTPQINTYYNRFAKPVSWGKGFQVCHLTTLPSIPEGTCSSSREFIKAMNEHKYNSVTSSVLVTHE